MVTDKTRAVLAKRFRTMRGAHSQAAIAAVAGVSPATVSNWESATHEIGAYALTRLAIHWNVSADYLLGIIEEPKPTRRKRKPKQTSA